MKKYLAKFAVDILPSVAATVIGAYIVNHYIVTKPAPSAPVASVVSTVDPKAAPEAAKIDIKADAKTTDRTTDKTTDKSADTSVEIGNARGPGVKAKGISERAILEKAAAEKAQEKQEKQEKSGENVADKPAETASIPAETRRHQPAPREKTAARSVPAPAPLVVSTPAQAAPAEAASALEERRDANDLARAAIDRLRGSNDGSPRPQEAARTQDAARVPEAARIPDAPRVVLAPAVRPLPPPIMVSTPIHESIDSTTGYQEMKPPYAAASRNDGPRRPTPPADIPSPPLDLRAEASEPVGRAEGSGPLARARSTAEDVLSAAKSVFHVVLPK
ncbi:MAG: hypothetical protein Q7T45_02455 [Bradyrhizobium sp.]|nr:hypothetical protein [Bradyrhizobium sp.]MDO8396657.1 hypothetical protein [Bradyrhizobium sp.]